KAYELVNERLTKEVADPNDLLKYQNTIHLKTDPPKRTDLEVDYRERKFVYVISHPEYPGEYKVGIAKNWKSRLNSYQTSDPDRRYKVEFTHLTPLFRETEKYIHNLFPNKHEWVQGDLATIIQSIRDYKNV
ncbi:MAG: GIY-YIG nuclease family protein, partial [Rhodobacteraceae bacterium]|nr:GIY-YIG nuclease family protein [Paracoccaceae bacterium]